MKEYKNNRHKYTYICSLLNFNVVLKLCAAKKNYEICFININSVNLSHKLMLFFLIVGKYYVDCFSKVVQFLKV